MERPYAPGVTRPDPDPAVLCKTQAAGERGRETGTRRVAESLDVGDPVDVRLRLLGT
jgi:hypothetical protein